MADYDDLIYTRKQVIDTETAREEFKRWAQAWHIGRKMQKAKEEAKELFEEYMEVTIGLIETGLLSYEDNTDKLIYKLVFPEVAEMEQMRLKRPTGAAWLEQDKYPEEATSKRGFVFLCNMSGYAMNRFAKLEAEDSENLQTIAAFFLIS